MTSALAGAFPRRLRRQRARPVDDDPGCGGARGSAVYSASKAAVNAITEVLALELAERRIRVNAIMTAYFDREGARAIGVKGGEQEALPRVGVDDG